jgi:hypothetical protein
VWSCVRVTVFVWSTVVVVVLPHAARSPATAAVTGTRKGFLFFLKGAERVWRGGQSESGANLSATTSARQAETPVAAYVAPGVGG